MAILDEVTPRYYEVHTLSMERRDGVVVASYQIMIRNALGNGMKIINASSVLTPEERAVVAAIYQRDEAQFEAATGLEKWVPPPEDEPEP